MFERNTLYDKYRLAIILILAFFYSFRMFPLQAMIISVVCILGYIVFITFTNNNSIAQGKTLRRKEALAKADVFLGYYSDIWKNLKLSNTNCYLTLASNGTTIRGTEKNKESDFYRTFKVIKSNVHAMDEVWNMFCKNFSYNKTYDGIVEDCKLYDLVIEETILQKSEIISAKSNLIKVEKKELIPEKVDINNASVEELTDLPGISVIMAKKAIKRREDIMGFKTIDEFLSYLNVQPTVAENLKPILYLTEIQGVKKKIEHYKERNIDL